MSNEFTSNTETLGQLCVLTGNSAKSSGGAIYVNDSSVSISYFLVSNNTATIGGNSLLLSSSTSSYYLILLCFVIIYHLILMRCI